MAEACVVDASVIVDLLLGTEHCDAIADRLLGTTLHAPAHSDAEVLSAIGRLQRAGALSAREASERLTDASTLPLARHLLPPLLVWARGGTACDSSMPSTWSSPRCSTSRCSRQAAPSPAPPAAPSCSVEASERERDPVVTSLLAILAILAVVVTLVASHRLLPQRDGPSPPGPRVVLVLGDPSRRDGRARSRRHGRFAGVQRRDDRT